MTAILGPDQPSVVLRRSVPGVVTALRLAAGDWYFHSAVLLAANVVWGLGLVLVVVAAQVDVALAAVAAVFLALPTAGVFRVAASVVRGEGATLRDALDWRQDASSVVLLGGAMVGVLVIGSADVMLGLGSGELPGVALATMAGWGIVAAAAVGCMCWPVLCDPARAGRGLRSAVRVAAAALLSAPRRTLGALAVSMVVLALSAILFVALLTISLGFVALVLCHVMLPLADRIDPA